MSAREDLSVNADDFRRFGMSIEETGIAAQILGITTNQAAEAVRRFAEEFHPERLMHDIAVTFTDEERAELQRRVRASMIEHPDVSLVELLLEHGAAIEGERAES